MPDLSEFIAFIAKKSGMDRPDLIENRSIARAIPNAKLVYFEKANHLLAEEMREVTEAITEFLL